MAAQIGMSVLSMYTDTAPGDHNVGIDLSSGTVISL